MKPVLLILPEFGMQTYLVLIASILVIAFVLFLLFKKKVKDSKKFRNDIISYTILTLLIITGIYIFAPIPLRTYGVAVATGFIAGLYVATFLAKKDNIKKEYILDFGVYVLIGTVLGARLFYFLFYDFDYLIKAPLKFFAIWEGGMVFYGGVVGAILTGYYYVKKTGLNVLKLADISGIATLLGLSFGRWGCFGYGCCFGKCAPSNFPFSIKFPARHYYGYTPAFEHHLSKGLVQHSDKFSLPVYPTQILSSANALLLFFILFVIYKRKKFDGQVASFSLIFYAITRFLIEFLRVNPQFLGLTVSQWVGIFVLIFGLWLYYYSYKRSLHFR